MRIKCGSCKQHHESVAEIRTCYGRALEGNGVPVDQAFVAGMTDQDVRETIHRDRANAARRQGSSLVLEALKRQAENNAKEYERRGSILAPKPAQQPQAATAKPAVPQADGATAKQQDFIRRLLDQREVSQKICDAVNDEIINGQLSRRRASRLISRLLEMPHREARPSAQPVTATNSQVTKDGIYLNPDTGEIFKVQFNRAQGDGRRLYAKRLLLDNPYTGATRTTGILDIPKEQAHEWQTRWDYQAGLLGKIRPEWRMTLAEAAQFGALYGRCMRCHRELTNEISIELAMGPICRNAKNWG